MNYPRFAALALPFAVAGSAWLAFVNMQQDNGAERARVAAAAAPLPVGVLPPTPDERKAVFSAVYDQAKWGTNVEGAGNSGTGSTLSATLIYRTFLQQFLKENDIHSVVDAGCGDWEFSQAIDWSGIDYKGFDIVESVVQADRANFGKPNIQFFSGDIVETDLPPADLLISKHVLQHLPTADVQKFLKQASKYKHVLFTDGVNPASLTANNNVDIKPGEYRELDLLRPPFNLRGVKVLTYWDGLHMHQVVHAMPRVSAK